MITKRICDAFLAVCLLGAAYTVHQAITFYPANEDMVGGAVAFQLLPEMEGDGLRTEIAVSKTPQKDISDVELLASAKQNVWAGGTLQRAHTVLRYRLKTRSRCAEIYRGCLTILSSDKEKSITIGAAL
jgi:hypothetical protein